MLHIITLNIKEIIRISTPRKVRRLAVFGSADDDQFDPKKSDLDLLVEFEKMQPVEHAEQFFGPQRISNTCSITRLILLSQGKSAIRISASP